MQLLKAYIAPLKYMFWVKRKEFFLPELNFLNQACKSNPPHIKKQPYLPKIPGAYQIN
jgi:hypothetical protein